MVQENKTLDETKNPKYTHNHNLNMARPLGCIKPGDEIVISGMSGSFPGARNVHEFRDNLFNKVHTDDESQSRWPGYEHPELPKIGGIVPDITKYDAGFFGVHQRQSNTMDAMVRQLQEKTIEAIFDAGLHPSDLENTRTGVYVGTCFGETEKKTFLENVTPHTYALTGCERSMQPHRLSYFLKLKGPSIVIDTACSSSLYAFEHAFKDFTLGEIDNAIVVGTNLCLHPFVTLQFARLGVLSMDGACKVFDKTGNGYLRSEAIVVVLLQRVKNAKRVYAEAVYAKTNCDGYKEQGITFPSSETQAALLNDLYKECDVDPFSLSYLEAHGTGTTVGDSEEASAIDAVLTKNRKSPLLIGSLKSNIGHTEPSSGVCSIIKCIIGMETGFIPPNINYSTPRDEIRGIIEGRMKVVTEKMRFQDNKGLVGINSFGFGGANCHVLLRWNQKQKVNKNNGLPTDALPRLVCVSGRTEDAVSCLLDELNNNEHDIEHINLLHNIFRKNIQNHMYRGYTIVSTSGEVTRSLQYFNGNQKPLCVLFGELSSWREVGNNLMDMPVFANSIQRMHEILSDREINLSNIFLNNTFDNERNEILGSVAVQIGIIDTLHLLKIKPKNCLGFSFGVLIAAYYNEYISLKETINCALVMNEFLNEVNKQCQSKNNNFRQGNHSVNVNGDISNGTMTVSENLRKTLRANNSMRERLSTSLTDILGEQHSKNRHRSAEYFIDVLMNDLIPDFRSIDFNYILFKVTCSTIQEDFNDMIVISSINFKRKNYLVGLLESFGSLYEYGYNPQMENLYPAIDLPVSRGTRMISPYIKWKHDRDWFIPQFGLDLMTRNCGTAVCHVLLSDLAWTFLDGHVIDGRNLFPATGYLYLVWQTLASIYGRSMSDFKVVFENCKFIRATTIPDKIELCFYITIQKSTGNFEIVEGGALVVTGRVYNLDDDKQSETISYLHNDSSDALPLRTKDVYKELRLRGYHYKGGFRAIQECDSDASKAYIKWNENWITFMDNMLQMKILQFDSRLLYVPTYIAKLTINPQQHQAYIEKHGNSSDLIVYNDQSSGIISSGGIQIWGLTASSIARRKYLGTPVLEGYKFVSNIANLTTEESLRVNMQIILENTLAMKVKAVELIDDYSKNSSICLTPIILSVLEDQPLIQPSVKILSQTPLEVNVEVEDTMLKNESDCLLVIGTHILARPEVLKNASNALAEKGFILSRESLDFDISTNDLDIKIITVHKTPTEYLVLFKNDPTVHKYITFKISSLDNFSWVPKLKEMIEKQVSRDIVIYSENEPNSGILGLINCLRREPNGQNIRCMFIMDSDKKFQQSSDQHDAQLNKNLAVNIYKNGQWGTYRHLLFDKLDSMQSEHCFANVTSRGDLSSFKWIEGPLCHDMAVIPESKLVYIYYAALNFRDIMMASGKIEADGINRREQDCVLGLEFSGRDEKGNRIMGMLNGKALSTLALADSYLTYKVPDSWTLAEAATVPAVYLTVLYALYTRGQIKQGESILIHSGTGGIGQAAIQIALHCGCTVFTTVGTQEKRDFLKKTFPQLKNCHIGNSRDELFEQMILNGTEGRGVDMVLNSLAEEKLLASVRCLARGGRFIEIGKFDLSSNNQLNLLLFKKNASFQGVMLDMLFKESPHKKLVLSKLMNEVTVSGAIKPLNRTIFKFDEVEQAFRFMASGKHMGKVLVQIRNPEDNLLSIPSIQKYSCSPRYQCDPKMVYIILGGLGGFGLELADWLVLRGANKLVLTSRSGLTTGYQRCRIRIWQSYGTIVNISKADITSKSGCQELIEQSSKLGNIGAIFNLAVVLSDSIFENQSPESFLTSFQPKALATQYLDEVTRKLCPNLRDFVIFSSVSCGRGNAGQTNYGMANSVMERICESRRRDGYPGLAIQWGAVGDVGLVAEMQEEHIELAIGGTLQQPISSCLKVLDGLLKQKEHVIVSSIVVAEKQRGKTADNIVDAVCNVLGIADVKLISEHSTLAELGMDSMTAVEIRQILERDFDVVLNAKDLRTITLLRLKEIQTENCIEDQNDDVKSDETEFGLGTILRLIGTEAESHLLHIRLKSNVKVTALAPKLLLFPGIEGFSKVYEPLAVHLNAHAVCLQYSYYNTNYTVDSTVNSLLPFVEEYVTKNEPFKFIAYSYGTLIAMEVANILESKGYIGTIICLDGSELWLKEMSKIFESQTDEILQTALISQLLTVLVSKQAVLSNKEILFNCKSWGEKLDLLVNITKDTLTMSEKYQRLLANGFYKRIGALKKYNSSYSKLKSNVHLYKAKTASIQGLPEDYGLSQFTENPVEVKIFEGNHVTILDNELLPEAINSVINEKH